MVVCTVFAQKAEATDWYVALDGTGQGTGGWENATNNLQDAIDACTTGDTVWVSNGVYQAGGSPITGSTLTNRIAILKTITVRSLSGDPSDTVIKGHWDSVEPNGPAAVRCVYMSGKAWLIGFTVTNGATLSKLATESAEADHRGGGIFVTYYRDPIGGISNCVIAGNAAAGQGGGAIGGTVYDSVIAGNTVETEASMQSRGSGGGVFNCKLFNCLLTDNSGSYGSASSGGTLENCLIISNNSTYATYSGVLYNSLIVNNQSSYANRGSKLYNCTVANNDGAGLYYSSTYATNCIIYFNKNGNLVSSVEPLSYCCTTPPQASWATGDGNITNEPVFVNMTANNFRLHRKSPAINAGTNGVWTTDSFDLDGLQRIDKTSGIVDMGCYEYEFPDRITILTIR